MSLETKLKENAYVQCANCGAIFTVKALKERFNGKCTDCGLVVSLQIKYCREDLTIKDVRVVAEKIQKIRLNLVPQKQYYDFEVDKLLKKIFLLLVEGGKNK